MSVVRAAGRLVWTFLWGLVSGTAVIVFDIAAWVVLAALWGVVATIIMAPIAAVVLAPWWIPWLLDAV